MVLHYILLLSGVNLFNTKFSEGFRTKIYIRIESYFRIVTGPWSTIMDISCAPTYLQQVLTVPLFLHCTDSSKAPCRSPGYGPRSSQLSEVDYILKISNLHLLVVNSHSSKSSSLSVNKPVVTR